MDSLTQAVYGATVQGALLGRQQGRKALIYGAILGTLPDLDVFVRYPDPISNMTYHRGFSHSVLLITAVSVVFAWLLRRWRPSPEYSGGRLAFTIWAVLITHVLLDAFTVYGTQLWWPFTPTPVSNGLLFIVDPVFTLPLILAVVGSAVSRQRPMPTRWCWWALAFTTTYLVFATVTQQTLESRVRHAFNESGVTVQRLQMGSAPLSNLLWRVVVEDDRGGYYEGFVGLLDSREPRFERFELGREVLADPVVREHPQRQRLEWFTGNWLRYDILDNQLVVTDLRMGHAGRHFFRFVIAERAGADQPWQNVVPYDWHAERGDTNELQLLLRRIWDDSVEIPLKRWEADMRAPNGS